MFFSIFTDGYQNRIPYNFKESSSVMFQCSYLSGKLDNFLTYRHISLFEGLILVSPAVFLSLFGIIMQLKFLISTKHSSLQSSFINLTVSRAILLTYKPSFMAQCILFLNFESLTSISKSLNKHETKKIKSSECL